MRCSERLPPVSSGLNCVGITAAKRRLVDGIARRRATTGSGSAMSSERGCIAKRLHSGGSRLDCVDARGDAVDTAERRLVDSIARRRATAGNGSASASELGRATKRLHSGGSGLVCVGAGCDAVNAVERRSMDDIACRSAAAANERGHTPERCTVDGIDRPSAPRQRTAWPPCSSGFKSRRRGQTKQRRTCLAWPALSEPVVTEDEEKVDDLDDV